MSEVQRKTNIGSSPTTSPASGPLKKIGGTILQGNEAMELYVNEIAMNIRRLGEEAVRLQELYHSEKQWLPELDSQTSVVTKSLSRDG